MTRYEEVTTQGKHEPKPKHELNRDRLEANPHHRVFGGIFLLACMKHLVGFSLGNLAKQNGCCGLLVNDSAPSLSPSEEQLSAINPSNRKVI